MADSKPRKDADNLAKLEALRPVHERLKEERIRAASDVERYEADYAAACAAAEREFGTADIDEIRQRIQETRTNNTREVDEFEASLDVVQKALAALDGA